MISNGRYDYHLLDIAAIRAKPKPLHPVDEANLKRMMAEVTEYEKANNLPYTQRTALTNEPGTEVKCLAGHWFIIRRLPGEILGKYLHSDGVWRDTTFNEKDELTGYYDTKEDAEATLSQQT